MEENLRRGERLLKTVVPVVTMTEESVFPARRTIAATELNISETITTTTIRQSSIQCFLNTIMGPTTTVQLRPLFY